MSLMIQYNQKLLLKFIWNMIVRKFGNTWNMFSKLLIHISKSNIKDAFLLVINSFKSAFFHEILLMKKFSASETFFLQKSQ